MRSIESEGRSCPCYSEPVPAARDFRDRLADLRRRWRRQVLLRGVCGGLAVVLAGAIVFGLLDYAIHLPALVRAVVLVGLVAAGAREIIRVARQLPGLHDDLAIALRVEDHFPALNDALASTIQFEHQPDGSTELQDATRHYAIREAHDCDFRELLDGRPARRALLGLVAALTVLVPVALFFPRPTVSAVVRLLDPFGDHPWPLKTNLTIEAPDWLARGEPFVLHGTLAGVIPERIAFGFALDGMPASEQPIPYSLLTTAVLLSSAWNRTAYPAGFVTACRPTTRKPPGSRSVC